jgi:hypothetical protein
MSVNFDKVREDVRQAYELWREPLEPFVKSFKYWNYLVLQEEFYRLCQKSCDSGWENIKKGKVVQALKNFDEASSFECFSIFLRWSYVYPQRSSEQGFQEALVLQLTILKDKKIF